MKAIGRFLYWVGVIFFGILAVAGVAVGATVCAVVCFAVMVLAILTGAAVLVTVLPVCCWCAYLDPTDWKLIKTFGKAELGNLN